MTHSELVPTVCPKSFHLFFGPMFDLFRDISNDDRIPGDIRVDAIKDVGASLALELTARDPDLAAAMCSRFWALMQSAANGTLAHIGDRYFGDPGHLVRRLDPDRHKIKTVAILAAAFADLLPLSMTFTADCLAAAILATPAGCPEDLTPCSDACDMTIMVFVVKIPV
jgi:hypothetical protein